MDVLYDVCHTKHVQDLVIKIDKNRQLCIESMQQQKQKKRPLTIKKYDTF